MLFALITETRLVTASELYRMAAALEINAAHCSKAYQLDEPVGIVVVDRESELPAGCYPVVMVGEGGDSATLADHWFDPLRAIPAARVLVQNTSGLNAGTNSICEATSHEIVEALCNPRLSTWSQHPTRAGVEVAREVADPCQDDYVARVNGTDWHVANFVTPAWFAPTGAVDFDWCKRLRAPGEIGPDGYAVMRERRADGGWRQWSEGRNGPIGQNSRELARKQHHASRTQRLLAGP